MKKILNSYHLILSTLILLCLFLLIYTNEVINSTKIYTFNGESNYIKIESGVISLNHNINLFEGTNITYIGKDVKVKSFDIGYYIIKDDNYIPIASIAGEDKELLSLKSLIEGINNFNIVEFNNKNIYLTKENIKRLDNGLYFVIHAIDNKDNKIDDVTKLDLIKLSK